MAVKPGFGRRLYQSIGSLRTGIILLILTGIAAAAGTVILQRPTVDPDQIQAAYSPETLRVLDAIGLTDVYHSWWFLSLLGLLALSIILVSLDRWPNAWRFYSRPYRRTDPSFRAVLPLQATFPISDPARALAAADNVLKKNGFHPERVVDRDEVALYGEKCRYAVLAVYVVHTSLLLIMAGGIIDALCSYRGYLSLVPGQPPVSELKLRNGKIQKLPFAVRCDETGQENYTGEYAMMPKRWWSKLAVLENDQEKVRKEIVVNDPLVYQGVRFYQSGYGTSGALRSAKLAILQGDNPQPSKVLYLTPGGVGTLDDGSSLKLSRFIPDAYAMDGGIYQRSTDLGNAAAQITLTGKDGNTQTAWLVRTDEAGPKQVVLLGPYDDKGRPITTIPFRLVASLDMLPFTGLEVSHEPGQWGVWSGCVLMGVGLFLAFWVLHQRYWVVPITDKQGRQTLWVGAAANKNREGFAVRFHEVAAEIEKELQAESHAAEAVQASAARS